MKDILRIIILVDCAKIIFILLKIFIVHKFDFAH